MSLRSVSVLNLMVPVIHHHYHSLFTHYVLVYNSVVKEVVRKSYSKKRNLKIHVIQIFKCKKEEK